MFLSKYVLFLNSLQRYINIFEQLFEKAEKNLIFYQIVQF